MKKIIVSLFLIFSVFVFLPKAEAQPTSSCEWVVTYCITNPFLGSAYCVNAGGNSGVNCACGTPAETCYGGDHEL